MGLKISTGFDSMEAIILGTIIDGMSIKNFKIFIGE